MTRQTRRKALYAATLAALICGVLVFSVSQDFSPMAVIILGLLFFLPGRINGYFWRAFYNGRRLADTGQLNEAKREYERFLVQVRAHPWQKHLILLVWGFYTRDIEAMVMNNLGGIALQQGDLAAAEAAFRRAIEIDSYYPIPYQNLAVVAECRGDRAAAEAALSSAHTLGYKKTSVDGVADRAASLLARLESRPKSAGGTA